MSIVTGSVICIAATAIVADLSHTDKGENMNYYGAKELAESFRTVRKNTIQVAEDIPEGLRKSANCANFPSRQAGYWVGHAGFSGLISDGSGGCPV